mmetsp:Transcript_8099/g.15852  ORF Transcript_8099/g.15852 Transcript_8099/m.15852 type:complete len:217 (+) Transcript_8099:1402-2052(+)
MHDSIVLSQRSNTSSCVACGPNTPSRSKVSESKLMPFDVTRYFASWSIFLSCAVIGLILAKTRILPRERLSSCMSCFLFAISLFIRRLRSSIRMFLLSPSNALNIPDDTSAMYSLWFCRACTVCILKSLRDFRISLWTSFNIPALFRKDRAALLFELSLRLAGRFSMIVWRFAALWRWLSAKHRHSWEAWRRNSIFSSASMRFSVSICFCRLRFAM